MLSRCDFLLKSASAVSEFAILFNPNLINNSYDFSLPDQPMPSWLPQNETRATATKNTTTSTFKVAPAGLNGMNGMGDELGDLTETWFEELQHGFNARSE